MDQTEIGTIDKSHYSLKEILAQRQAFVNDKIFEIDVRKQINSPDFKYVHLKLKTIKKNKILI